MVKAIVGACWGDEGKGKITDVLAEDSDIVVRFQGGSNAGHTIINEYGKFALHQLPSGVFRQIESLLPGLIFGGLINAFSPADTEQPVLNSETAIVENANDITFTINSILGEALDDVMARIEADFASSGADQMEIKNPYSSGPVYNANLIISQYCAARDEDFESISLDDLAAVLRENKENLYSYTSARESREV